MEAEKWGIIYFSGLGNGRLIMKKWRFRDKGRKKNRVMGCESNETTLYINVKICMYIPKIKKNVD